MGVAGVVVVDGPHLGQHAFHAAEAAEAGVLAQAGAAVAEEGAEAAGGTGDAAGDQQHPDEAAVEAVGPAGDRLEAGGELVQQVGHLRLRAVEAGNQAAQVDAGGGAEGGRHGGRQGARVDDAVLQDGRQALAAGGGRIGVL